MLDRHMAARKRVAVVMKPVRPYCRAVLRGVASVSAQAQWECILIPADAPTLGVELGGFVHGLIGHFSEKLLLEHAERAGVPAVDISPARRDAVLPRVSTDDRAVGRLAAAHLLSLGLPHFAFFGTRSHYYSLLREQGFRQAIGGAGLSCHVLLNGNPDAPTRPARPRRATGRSRTGWALCRGRSASWPAPTPGRWTSWPCAPS
jgi:DNA-binding LacI/PurR family transcriptional regulator